MDKYRLQAFLASLGVATGPYGTAHADIWKWEDALGKTHYVATMRPIYTWLDENGKVGFSDTPDHENARSVELVWHSSGDLFDETTPQTKQAKSDRLDFAGETAEERSEREQAQEYNCGRAREIYDSYVNAPRLYKTNEAGERIYLSDDEVTATIAETKVRVDVHCNT